MKKKTKLIENISNKNTNINIGEKSIRSSNDFLQNMIFLPVVLLLAVVPLILRWNINKLAPEVARFWKDSLDTDLFCQTKGTFIVILGIVMLLALFFTVDKKKLKELKNDKVLLVSLLVFTVFLILSSFTAVNKDVAMFGAPERHEGLFAHLSYVIIFVYLYTVFKTADNFRYIKLSILVLSGIMIIIGFTQIVGKDILLSDFVKNLVIPNEYKDMVNQEPVAGYIYLTLMHSNYVGSYCSMIIPFLAMIAISSKENTVYRIVAGIFTVLTAFILVKSQSQAGIVGTGVALLFVIIVNFRSIFKNKKILIGTIVFLVAVAGIANIATKGLLIDNTVDILNDAKQIFVKDKDYKYDPTYGMPIYDVKAENNNIKIQTVDGELNVEISDGLNPVFKDSKGNILTSNYDPATVSYTFALPFDKFKLFTSNDRTKDNAQFAVAYNEVTYFLLDWSKQEGASLIDAQGNKYELIVAPHVGFEGSEKAGSMRGYIWSRTLPLIAQKPLFGYGPDNFLMAFPHYDMVAKTYAYDTPFMIVDKPHNVYILYAVNSGIFALMALLVLWGKYVVDSLKLYAFKKEYSQMDYYAIACFTAIMGYLAAGFFNDSVPTVAPIFWVLLGTGYALNRMNKSNNPN